MPKQLSSRLSRAGAELMDAIDECNDPEDLDVAISLMDVLQLQAKNQRSAALSKAARRRYEEHRKKYPQPPVRI